MTTDALGALLRQILADPTDTALRSVYADALMAAGDPRGELIAVESELDRPGTNERRAALREAHARTWWPELPAHRIRTERGFATAISVAPERLDACARLFATEPIEEVELANGPLNEPTLPFAPAPWQARIRRLAVRGSIRPPQFTALCASPLGAQLESLTVSGIAYPVAIEGGLPRCRRLCFARTGLGYATTTLLRWHHLGALEELDLRSCIIEPHTLDEVLALDLAALRVLRLSGNTLGAAGTRILQQRLRRLPGWSASSSSTAGSWTSRTRRSPSARICPRSSSSWVRRSSSSRPAAAATACSSMACAARCATARWGASMARR